MPELPEVETIVRELKPILPDRDILRVRVIRDDLLREEPDSFRRALEGTSIEDVARRGKKIVLKIQGGTVLTVNLGMTGQLLFSQDRKSTEPTVYDSPPHLGIAFHLSGEARLNYVDVRRFGCLRRLTEGEWATEEKRLGPEPLDPALTASVLHRRLQGSRAPARSWLLDQTRIAGIGNIYAVEALFMAGIHPETPAGLLNPSQARNLLTALREVLRRAIAAGGTTLRDYRTASGETGRFSSSLRAYGREGEPCPRCNTPMQRIVFANRSAFLCPRCQPRTRR